VLKMVLLSINIFSQHLPGGLSKIKQNITKFGCVLGDSNWEPMEYDLKH